MRKRSTSGFTLIELMVTVGILGVLASIALPMFQRYVYKSYESEREILIGRMEQAVMTYFGEHGAFPSSITPTSSVLAAGWNPPLPGLPPSPLKKDWVANFQHWRDIFIDVGGQVRYHYFLTGNHNGGNASFTLLAYGDIDADGQTDMRLRSWCVGSGCGTPSKDWVLFNEVNDLQEY